MGSPAYAADADPWQQEREQAEYADFLAGDPDPLPWPPAEPTPYRYEADGTPFF